MDEKSTDPATISDEVIDGAIRSIVAERGTAKTACPSEVARRLAGPDEKRWRLLMKPIRARAVRLAKAGEIAIKRKGKAVDPDAFKGIYRLGRAEGAK